MVGLLCILGSTAAFNGAVVLLAVAARSRTSLSRVGLPLLLGVLRRPHGLIGEGLNALGWGLEIVGLARISLTVARVLGAGGQVLLVILARSVLHEPLGRREVFGAGATVAGIAVVGFVPPAHSGAEPSPAQWLLLLVLLGPVALAPYVLPMLGRLTTPTVSAVGAGVAYALSGLFTKGIADALNDRQWPSLLASLTGVAIFASLASISELNALQRGRAAAVVPLETALVTVIPIVCAPLFFAEHWPSTVPTQALLAGGILLTVIGAIVLAQASARVLAQTHALPATA